MNYWLMPLIDNVSLINEALHLPQKYSSKSGRQKGMNMDMTLKRMCAVKLLREKKFLSYPQIAKKLQMKNHTSVMAAEKRINNLLLINDQRAINAMEEVSNILKQKHFI